MKVLVALFAVAVAAAGAVGLAQGPAPYDVILRRGTILDGTGSPRYMADIAISNGTIARIGDLANEHGTLDLDVTGLFVTPGFIDLQSRATIDGPQRAGATLLNGVTTEIVVSDLTNAKSIDETFGDQLSRWTSEAPPVNIGAYVDFNAGWNRYGHSNDGRPVYGLLSDFISRNLSGGAWGVSAVLDDRPPASLSAPTLAAAIAAMEVSIPHFEMRGDAAHTDAVSGQPISSIRSAESAESAVRRMSAIPAASIGMVDRGFLAVGMSADIIAFDPRDAGPGTTASLVLVNGEMVVRAGAATGIRAGKLLRRNVWTMRARPFVLDGQRRVALAGTVANGQIGMSGPAITITLHQGPADTRASGVFRLADPKHDVALEMTEFGVLQVAPDWATFTGRAKLRATGDEEAVTVVVDRNWLHPTVTVLAQSGQVASGDVESWNKILIEPQDEQLVARILSGDGTAERIAGESGDRRYVPALKQRLSALDGQEDRKAERHNVRVELAQLDERDQAQELWCEATVQPNFGVFDFARVGGWAGIRALRRLMEHDRYWDFGKERLEKNSDAIPAPPGFWASEYLHEMLPGSPRGALMSPDDTTVFRWLDAHQEELSRRFPMGEGVDFSPAACKDGKPRTK